MHRHQGIVLQQRVGSRSLEDAGRIVDERIGRSHHQQSEERADDKQRRPRDFDDVVAAVAPVIIQNAEGDGTLQHHPQHQRSFKRGPESGDRIKQWRERGVVLSDVGQRKVMRNEGEFHNANGEKDASERETRPPQCVRVALGANRTHLLDHSSHRANETQVQAGSSEPGQRHRTDPLGAFTRLGCAAMYCAVCLTRICVP